MAKPQPRKAEIKGDAIELVGFHENAFFLCHDTVLNVLPKFAKPVYIYAHTGPARMGKSTTGSLAFNYFTGSKHKPVFETSDETAIAQTSGVWINMTPIPHPQGGSILLMDVAGIGIGPQENLKLNLFGYMMASLVTFACGSAVNDTHREQLAYLAGAIYQNGDAQVCPSLVLLTRNVSKVQKDSQQRQEYANRQIDAILSADHYDQEDIQVIREHFSTISFFGLPNPASEADNEVLDSCYIPGGVVGGSIPVGSSLLVECLLEYFNFIYNQAKPKCAGEMLLDFSKANDREFVELLWDQVNQLTVDTQSLLSLHHDNIATKLNASTLELFKEQMKTSDPGADWQFTQLCDKFTNDLQQQFTEAGIVGEIRDLKLKQFKQMMRMQVLEHQTILWDARIQQQENKVRDMSEQLHTMDESHKKQHQELVDKHNEDMQKARQAQAQADSERAMILQQLANSNAQVAQLTQQHNQQKKHKKKRLCVIS